MSDHRGCGLLAGRVLFLAGVGPLMGAATAVIVAREGARVVLAARREDTINEIAKTIRAHGGQALIGEVVVFLLSDRASVITGEIIHLDGGLFAKAAWPSTTTPRVPPPPVPAT